MDSFDVVIQNSTVVIASDTSVCDVGVRDGCEKINATGLFVLPGGVEAHCHLGQPMGPEVQMADDFESGTRSAASGGTTTVIAFTVQEKSGSLKAAVEGYHGRKEGKACLS